jgi:hypothetical protein
VDVFFADDSVQRASRRGLGKLVAFGGIAFEEHELAPFAATFERVLASFSVPPDVELKWSPDPRKDRWLHDEFKDPERRDCYEAVLGAARQHGGRAIVVVWDTGRTNRPVSEAFDRCVDYAFERVETHFQKVGRLGLVVADRPGGGKSEEDAFLESFLLRVTLGTEYKKGQNVQLNVLTTPSHLLRHLQTADLVTGIATGAVGGNRYALALAGALRPLLLRNALGTIGGTGLKLVPQELVNLHYHCFGEVSFAKVSAMTGWTLPAERGWWPPRGELPYFRDDGL